jgi:hypothetical protein
MLTEQQTRDALFEIWGQQACQNPAHWPEALENLLRGRIPDERDVDEEGNLKEKTRYPSGGLRRYVDEATRALTQAFVNQVPVNPPITVWRIFPKLTKANCARLADRLVTLAQLGNGGVGDAAVKQPLPQVNLQAIDGGRAA